MAEQPDNISNSSSPDSSASLLAIGPIEVKPFAELLSLALPTVAQMMSYTLMQLLDAWMLAHASGGNVDAATAVGNAGLLAFAFISFGMGVLWIVNTLVSQSFGRKDYHECGRYVWQGVWVAVIFSIVMLAFIPLLGPAFKFMGHEARLVQMEDTYIRIVLAASIFKLLGAVFSQFLLAIDRPKLVLLSTVGGVAVNALAGWVMIFGVLGCPKLGVVGAAWAQNIGVAVETAILIGFSCTAAIRKTYNLADWKPRWAEMKTLLVVGTPSGLQILADILAWTLFGLWILARFGTAAMAGQNFMMQYMKVSFMPAFGISVAVTALVGRYIGMRRPDIAEQRANLGFVVCAIYMVICGLGFFLGRHVLMELFTNDPEVLRIGATLLGFAAIYQFFDAMYIVYNGALRGAGDTFVPAVATAILNWGITVGGGFLIAVKFPQWGIAGPWTIATGYGIILGLFIWLRFKRGKWRQIHLEDAGDSKPGEFPVKLTDFQPATEK